MIDAMRATHTVVIRFSTRVHSAEAVKKAAHQLSDVATADINVEDDDYVCVLDFRDGDEEVIERAIYRLKTEVVDQGLREVIKRETTDVRNAILGYAFSRTGLQGDG